MKLIYGVSLTGVVIGSVLSLGLAAPAEAATRTATQADCTASKTAPVNTDGGQHYVAVCAQGVYVQANEVASAPTGSTFANVTTGQAPVDALTPTFAVPQPSAQCPAKPTGSPVVYTDGGQHYAGVCGMGANAQVYELSMDPAGKQAASVTTGQAPVDTLLPTLAFPAPRPTTQCTAGAKDMVVIYTDALQHALGACDSSGNNIKVGELMGSLTDRNNLVDVDTKFLNVQVQTQAQGGTGGAILHPKVVITPGK